MRKTVRTVLLLYVFAIPWEYSLDLGDPFGNVARILGLVLLLVAIPATIQAGGIRTLAERRYSLLFSCSGSAAPVSGR